MIKKIKRLSISSIAILLVLVVFGGIALARTVRKDFYDMRASEDGLIASVKRSAITFSTDYEQLIPHERRMNTLLYYATGIFNSNHVIWGKDDWLFYSSTNSGDPIADYTGANSYTEEELETAKNNMLDIQQKLNEKNIQFCLLIPPNKENVYAQYMPDKYQHTDKTRTDILVENLAKNGVNAVNPKQALLDCDSQYRTYYKLDTHWNELGAYIGIREALHTLGTDLPKVTSEMVEEGDHTVSDLADMVGLRSVFPKDNGFRVSKYTQQGDVTNEQIGELTHYHNENADIDKTILLVGDSFRDSMIPILISLYKDFYMVHREQFKSDMINTSNPDEVILEIVERHSKFAKDFSIN